MTRADLLDVLLAATVVLRGLGAGIICGVIAITFPTRRRLGLVPYAQFTRAQYRGIGVKAYGALTVLGALLTATALTVAIWWHASASVIWLTAASLAATALAFVGVARALPPMFRLWQTSDDDPALVAGLLDRFARAGTFSALWHAVAFTLIVTALAAPHR